MQGEVEKIDAKTCNHSSDVLSLLSDAPRMETAIGMSECLSASNFSSGRTYSVKREIACGVRDALHREQTDFWMLQALIVAYRAIPWKYLEHP
jgi:hypothetical protein